MASGKDSFILYTKYVHTARKLSDEMAGKLYKMILEYVNDTNPVTDDMVLDLLFEPIKQDLKEDLRKWEAVCDRNRENGKSGGRPKKDTQNPENPVGYLETQKTQTNPPQPKKPRQTRYDCDSDSECDNEKIVDIPVYSFDEFWNDYGKKEDRKKCETKWKKITDKQKDAIRVHVPLYVQSTPDIQYRKNPSTYLNNECWNNEIIQRKPVSLPPPNYNPTYERWDGKKRWAGSVEIPYDAPPKPSNVERWDNEKQKWVFSNF